MEFTTRQQEYINNEFKAKFKAPEIDDTIYRFEPATGELFIYNEDHEAYILCDKAEDDINAKFKMIEDDEGYHWHKLCEIAREEEAEDESEIHLHDYVDMTDHDFDKLGDIWGEYEVAGIKFVGCNDVYVTQNNNGQAYYQQRALLDFRDLRIDQLKDIMSEEDFNKITNGNDPMENEFMIEWHDQKDINDPDGANHMWWHDYSVRNYNFYIVGYSV